MVPAAVAVPVGDVSASAFVDFALSVANAAGVESANAAVDIVAHPVSIHVSFAWATALTEGVELVPVAVALTCRDVFASAFVHDTGTVAHPARVQGTHATVDIVADAIVVKVFGALAAALADCVGLIPIAIAVSHGNEGASAGVNGAGSVADSACINGANARVYVVADAVKVHVEVASTSADSNGILLASEAIALAFLDVVATTLVNRSWTVANPTRVEGSNAIVFVVANAIVVHVGGAIAPTFAKDVLDVAFAVAFAFLKFVATAFKDSTRAIAFTAFVHFANALVDVVADSIGVHVGLARAATHAQSVFDVSVAVAFAVLDFVTSTLENRSRAVAFATLVEGPDAFVHVVADAVSVGIFLAPASANAQGIFCVAVTIAGVFGDGAASTFVHSTQAVADAASVKRADTIVFVVADTVRVGIFNARSAAFSDGIKVNARAAALVNGARSVAHAADVDLPDAIVNVVAEAVAVAVFFTISTTHPRGVGQIFFAPTVEQLKVRRDATAVVIGCIRVVIACLRVRAPLVQATAVVCVGAGVEVEGTFLCTPANHVGVEGHVESQIVLVVALRKDLNTHGAAEVAVGGELGQQHALFWS